MYAIIGEVGDLAERVLSQNITNMHSMLVMCTVCGTRPATTEDHLCGTCAESRRSARVVPLATAALSATALALGASLLLARFMNPEDAAGGGLPWARRLRGGPSALAGFCRDLTVEARSGSLDPVVGRDEEIERVIAILARRSKNNPVLLGEPGVGKTAIVEGLAQRIADGRVPATLLDKRVLSLSVGRLVAGTKYRGEFESRVKRLLDEIATAGRTIILFIDELHALVGAGGTDGALDLSAMIKPELARGELQCIGATTFAEYRRYIEVDAALERRFQPVIIAEPSLDATMTILRALRERYNRHHNVIIRDDAIEAAVVLAARYIVERNFPDKAIDLIDEAAAATAMRGEEAVTDKAVAAVVAKWTGIPQDRLDAAAASDVLDLDRRLRKVIIGQDQAVEQISQALRRAFAGFRDPLRPLSTMLIAGPTGSGKTLVARALAEALFGDETALVRIDLAEYSEAHSISRLIGAPPGYAGHEEAGLLSEGVRRRPYSVVLFDEIERAHPDVLALLAQLLSTGRVTDAKGRIIEFRHAIVMLTSSLTAEQLRRRLRNEVLDRLDETVTLRALAKSDFAQIIERELVPIRHRLEERGVALDLSQAAYDVVLAQSESVDAGARNIARVVTRLVATPLSVGLLDGALSAGMTARLEPHNTGLAIISR